MSDKNPERSAALLAKEQAILAEEKKILEEERGLLKKFNRSIELMVAVLLLAVAVVLGSLAYWQYLNGRVYIENAEISAPKIDLAPQGSGLLQGTYVREGDTIRANDPVALVGSELVKAKTGGLVISVRNDIGKLFNRGEAVAGMIDPGDLRVVARVEEDKGLKDIRVGQAATFTVDAFGSEVFTGTVDEISPTSRDAGLAFSISDKRAVKEFEVKIRFNAAAHPELKNGMSAKVWISRR